MGAYHNPDLGYRVRSLEVHRRTEREMGGAMRRSRPVIPAWEREPQPTQISAARISGQRMGPMAMGKIKWFNDQKWFGFIADDKGGDDVFVHFSAVEMDGFKSLKEGQTVEYEAETSTKGMKATKVVPVAVQV